MVKQKTKKGVNPTNALACKKGINRLFAKGTSVIKTFSCPCLYVTAFFRYTNKMRHKLYLKPGDKVRHQKYHAWGEGEVVEEKHSELPGGFCFVRILFEDGNDRSFINDMNNELCCYYTGIRLIDGYNIRGT